MVKTAASALSVYGQRRLAFQVAHRLRRDVTDAILRRGSPRDTASAVAAVAVQLREVERGVDEGVLAEVRAVAQLAPLVVTLIALSSRLALTALGALLPFAIALAVVRRRFRAGYGRAAALAERLHAGVDELVRHVDLWRTFGAGARVRAALDASGQRAGRAAARAEAGRAALSGANEVLAAAALLVAVLFASRLPGSGREGLVAFAAVFFLMYRPLRDLGDARGAEERGAAALEALDEMMRGVNGAQEADEALLTTGSVTWHPAPLEVRGVCVERDGVMTPPTWFRAEPGEVVAIVGATGSGKTSLLRALLGLESAVGQVVYGELDLTRAGVGPAHRPFAWVPQEPAVVAATLAENVLLGVPTTRPPGGIAEDALATVGALSLRGRLDEALPAGGTSLSGGERQWLAIARALASAQPVLLLDEPTSGLDPEAQRAVLEALAALRGERTVVIVTHRTEPLAIADRVVRLGARAPVRERPNLKTARETEDRSRTTA